MKVVCISQARMASTRLPGKVLMPVCGRPLLSHHLERLMRARRLDEVVLATTVGALDDPLVAIADKHGLRAVRGPEDDVLLRFAMAADAAEADIVVRVTSDCPLIDPGLIDDAVARFQQGDADYCHLQIGSYPRGLDCEVFSRAALIHADRHATAPEEREHVTPYIYRRPELFRIVAIESPCPPADYRWCVDEPADFELVRLLLETLLPAKPDFTWRDCVAEMERHPHWRMLNDIVEQKSA